MIKVALAGTGGVAQYIAHFLSTQTYHQFFFLSRNQPNPGLTAKGWQVIQVNYSNAKELRYQLTGVDVVISTVSGQAQLALIDAAFDVHVRRFVPSEFEGPLANRPPHAEEDILDRGKRRALAALEKYKEMGMEYSVFACGIFYERFNPGGMAALQLGQGTNINGEGDFLVDIRHQRAQIIYTDTTQQEIYLCMTSVQDVARFIVAALELPAWPTEFRMRGDRLSIGEIIGMAETMKGSVFQKRIYTPSSLRSSLSYAVVTGDIPQQWRLHHLLAAANGRYDFDDANLNSLVTFQPGSFREWIYKAWA